MTEKQITHKFISIPHNGPIFPKASVNGPINTPYREDIETISILIMNGYKVTEHTPKGGKIQLNLSNFDTDHVNPAVVVEKKPVPAAQKVPADKTPTPSKDEEAELEALIREEEEAAQKEAKKEIKPDTVKTK